MEQEKIKNEEKKEEKIPEKSKEKKQEKVRKKKTEAVVNGFNIPISTKKSVAICKFIKNKEIKKAIEDLEQVIKEKKAVPMKGEIPHRKGKKMMSGRFPKNASMHFLKLLKNLSANCTINEIEEPIISEAVANIGARPYARFGKYRRKRTNLRIIAKEKKINAPQKNNLEKPKK